MDQSSIESANRDFSHIFMEGRKVFQAADSNIRVSNERRNNSNGYRWFWDSGKHGKKCINWNSKIPFCLDVKSTSNEFIPQQDYSAKNMNTITACSKVTERNYKLSKKNKRVQINKENELQYIESIKTNHRLK